MACHIFLDFFPKAFSDLKRFLDVLHLIDGENSLAGSIAKIGLELFEKGKKEILEDS